MPSPSEIDLNIPQSLQEPFRTALSAAAEGWVAEMGKRLLSLVARFPVR